MSGHREPANDRQVSRKEARARNRAEREMEEEIASLRDTVQKLMDERVTPALVSAAGTAGAYSRHARDMVHAGTDRTAVVVQHNPFYAVGIAVSFGVAMGVLAASLLRPAPKSHWY